MLPYRLTATQATALIARRELSCEELACSCLDRIEDRDPLVRAWAYVDRDKAIQKARALDNGSARGPLHGLPMGIKDIIATCDMPTCHNSPLYAGHQPSEDASCVAVIRSSGGIVLGKTETVEFASGGRTAPTRNPQDLLHTPGGSSSGSAAAVADMHVPLAIGTQTGGSVIRPAAFTGIYGFKPTHGLVSYAGARTVASSLDTIGWFARTAEDLLILAGSFRLPEAERPAPLAHIRIGICRGPMWAHTGSGARAAFDAAANRLADAGCAVKEIELASGFDRLSDAAYQVAAWEARPAFLADCLRFGTQLSPVFHEKVERAQRISSADAGRAYDVLAACRPAFDANFDTAGIDAILTPSAVGEAPEGLHETGDAILNTLWTALHTPCLAMPVGRGERGLPLGIQIIGQRFADVRLIHVATAIAPALEIAS